MRRIWVVVVLGLVVGLLASAQVSVDRGKLKQLALTVEEAREALGSQNWRLKVPAEPLPREPAGAITVAPIFQSALDTDLLLFAILYFFNEEERAKEFYAQPIALDLEGKSAEDVARFESFNELLNKELAVGAKDGTDEARLIGDKINNRPVLQFRKGQFVARIFPARISMTSTMDFPGEDLIKVAKKQLEKLVAFLKGS